MKKLFLILGICVLGLCIEAQEDTTFYYKNNKIQVSVFEDTQEMQVRVSNNSMDSAEILLFEGTYNEKGSSEIYPNFSFSKFISKKSRNYETHINGLFWGFSNLASRDLSAISTVENAYIKYSSYEIGWTMFSMVAELSDNNSRNGFFFYSGLGLRVQQYNAENNTYFSIQDNHTQQLPAPEGVYYNTSKLTSWYMHVPLMFEYQRLIKKNNFFVQIGGELGVRLSSKSKTMYRNEEGDKIKSLVDRKLNVNPITFDVKAEIGIGNLGLYARYGLIPIFRKGYGPDVIPVGCGIIWHF